MSEVYGTEVRVQVQRWHTHGPAETAGERADAPALRCGGQFRASHCSGLTLCQRRAGAQEGAVRPGGYRPAVCGSPVIALVLVFPVPVIMLEHNCSA